MEERGPPLIRYIVDASVIGPLIFEDEQGNIMAGLESCLAEGVCAAPAHWRLEVANQIVMGVRRRRVAEARAGGLLDDILALPLMIEDVRVDRALALATAHGLTIYDAAYLERATHRALPLLTFDRALAKAAARIGVATPAGAVSA
jgi:predicted nucleic acid-binding protein